ncbi:MAG TPA: PP2C family protein-serine/threonine phosphatase [Solirubrobacteraceae bacterium]|jgi:serine phosphatase RsbU (regulator of sigma subunit)
MSRRAGAARPFHNTLPSWAAAISIAGFALAGGGYAAAAAAKVNHPKQAASPSAQGSPVQPAGEAKPAAVPPPAPAAGKHGEAGSAPAAGSAPRDQAGRRTSPNAGKAQGASQVRTSGEATRGQGAAARPARQPRHAKPQSASAQGTVTGESQSESGGEEEVRAGLAPAVSQHGHGKGKHGKAKEPKAKEPKAKEPRTKEPAGKGTHEQPRPVAVPAAAAAAVTPLAPSIAPTLPPPAPAPPRIVAEARSAASGTLGHRSLRRRSRIRHLSSATARAHTPASAPVAVPATTPATATAKRGGGTRAARRPAHHSQSQLVTTVTRIINVIPTLLWGVIAALAALALALGAMSRIASMRARRLARQRRELLDDVGLLQAALLPELPGRLGMVGTSAAYRPASGPGAGGDFYDVFALEDGQVAVIVGDVSGHGRHALPHTTLLRFTLRAYLEAGLSPRGALQAAAPVLERQLGSSFATVVLATYQPHDRVLVYSCAGHPPPVVSGTRSIDTLTAGSSPPIGAGQATGRRQTVVSVPGEALACFYTDGVIEARIGHELYGAPRLKRTVAELGGETDAAAILDRVAEQSDRRPDDMAACLLHIDGEPIAPRVEIEEIELDRRDLERGRAERFLRGGGVEDQEIPAVLDSLRTAVARHGGVVLELHLGEETPQVVLRPQNVSLLHPRARATVGAVG